MKHSIHLQEPANERDAGFGLYVHWPFCAAKCPYCDFNSHVSSGIRHEEWADAFERRIERIGQETKGRILDSIFFGGGTPSLMAPETAARVVTAAQKQWRFRNSIEITLEANPTSVEFHKFNDFAGAGVNRVSLGIQALNNDDLRRLGRMHTVEEARKAWDTANAVFDRTSFDLIYARQHQTLPDWQSELADAIAMGPQHLSLYQLTIEDGTAFGDRFRKGGLKGLPEESLGADLYEATQTTCEAAGFNAYEVSNHTINGNESVHNQIYWRGGDYVGVGPGAHGRLTLNGKRFSTEQSRTPAEWLQAAQAEPSSVEQRHVLSDQEQAQEYLLMSMRLSEGCDLTRLSNLVPENELDRQLEALLEMGLIWRSSGRIGATKTGRPLLNAVLTDLATAF